MYFDTLPIMIWQIFIMLLHSFALPLFSLFLWRKRNACVIRIWIFTWCFQASQLFCGFLLHACSQMLFEKVWSLFYLSYSVVGEGIRQRRFKLMHNICFTMRLACFVCGYFLTPKRLIVSPSISNAYICCLCAGVTFLFVWEAI